LALGDRGWCGGWCLRCGGRLGCLSDVLRGRGHRNGLWCLADHCGLRGGWVGGEHRVRAKLVGGDRVVMRDGGCRGGVAGAEDFRGGAYRDSQDCATGQRNAGDDVPGRSIVGRWSQVGLAAVGADPCDQGSGWRSGARLATVAGCRFGHYISACVMDWITPGVTGYSALAPRDHPEHAALPHRPSMRSQPRTGRTGSK
jgi:hypothetical protein